MKINKTSERDSITSEVCDKTGILNCGQSVDYLTNVIRISRELFQTTKIFQYLLYTL